MADRFTLQKGDWKETKKGVGPSLAELAALGLSFKTGPNGEFWLYDGDGKFIGEWEDKKDSG